MSSNVFNFQQKLANTGNVQSQYKLGEMYETGSGIEKNIDQARGWYQQAAAAGYVPAKNRLTYLDIKANGYSKDKYGAWVETIKSEAAARNNPSMLLLARMYREGIGVEKDLDAAKELLDVLVTTGNLGVDVEIAQVDAALQARKQREQYLARERAAEAERLRKQREAQAQQAARASPKPVAASEEISAEEKRKRYEAVMRKLKEEQKILAEQQAWAEEREK